MKEEKPETDDFEERTQFGSKGKLFRKVFKGNFLIAKLSPNILAYSFVSDHSKHILYFGNIIIRSRVLA